MVKRRSDQRSVRGEMSMRRDHNDRNESGRGYSGEREDDYDTGAEYDYDNEDVDERSPRAGYRGDEDHEDNNYFNDEDNVHERYQSNRGNYNSGYGRNEKDGELGGRRVRRGFGGAMRSRNRNSETSNQGRSGNSNRGYGTGMDGQWSSGGSYNSDNYNQRWGNDFNSSSMDMGRRRYEDEDDNNDNRRRYSSMRSSSSNSRSNRASSGVNSNRGNRGSTGRTRRS